jgi:hypothetical protein
MERNPPWYQQFWSSLLRMWKGFSDRKEFCHHLSYAHNIREPRPTMLHPEITPDINDTSFCCKACERTSANKSIYFGRLENVHNMSIPHPRKIIKNPHLVPDINDPKNYCVACERSCKSNYSYHMHLMSIQKITIPTHSL